MPELVYIPPAPHRRELRWVGSSLEDLRCLPVEVRRTFGHALHLAQTGGRSPDAKPLRGFHGAGVVEIVDAHGGSAYRAVYAVRLETAVYVLHVFQKKSHRGRRTDRRDVDLIRARLAAAEAEDRARQERDRGEPR